MTLFTCTNMDNEEKGVIQSNEPLHSSPNASLDHPYPPSRTQETVQKKDPTAPQGSVISMIMSSPF